jgi:hypothetical protein
MYLFLAGYPLIELFQLSGDMPHFSLLEAVRPK